MIIKLKIEEKDGKQYTMLFGNSYKKYIDQIFDYCCRTQKWIDHYGHPSFKILSIERSLSDWKGWGGLKWCEEKDFQQELNREGVQSSEPDNPNPRQYSDMVFSKNYYAENKIKSLYEGMYQDRHLI